MDIDLLSVLLGSGLTIAATAGGFLYKTRKDRIHEYRTLLFVYLELLYACELAVRLSLDELIAVYLGSIERRFGQIPPDQRAQLTAALTKYLKPMAESVPVAPVALSEEFFHRTIQSLAKHDPILAFELSSGTVALVGIQRINEGVKTLAADGVLSEPELAQARTVFRKEIYAEIISELESDVSKLAWRTSSWTWVQAWRKLRSIKRRRQVSDESTIDALVGRLFKPGMLTTPQGTFSVQASTQTSR